MGAKKPIVALIFDFDDTLAPDSTSGLLDYAGFDVPSFWKTHGALVREGWDPIPAYLQMMIAESKKRPRAKRLTQEVFQAWGRALQPYPGVNSVFRRLREVLKTVNRNVQLEFYVVSSGVGEVLRGNKIAREFKDIFACEFAYNHRSEINAVKNVVSFTDKTRFLFQITKGIVGAQARANPFLVNRLVPEQELHVPFRQMIYVGDGFTDVPCFSLVQKNGGVAIGVYDRSSRERWGKAWGLTEEKRVSNLVAADYRKQSGLDDALNIALENIAKKL